MKHLAFFIPLLLAFAIGIGTLNAAPLIAASDTLNYYVINGHPVDHFDGSQIVGKKIATYDITVITPPDQGPVRVHEITTEGYTHPPVSYTIRPTGTGDMVEPSYVIDGKKASKKEFEGLNPAEIKSITVEKDGAIKVVTKARKKKESGAQSPSVVTGSGDGLQRARSTEKTGCRERRRVSLLPATVIKIVENFFCSGGHFYLTLSVK